MLKNERSKNEKKNKNDDPDRRDGVTPSFWKEGRITREVSRVRHLPEFNVPFQKLVSFLSR